MNYWAQTHGAIADFDDDARGNSEVMQEFLAGARLVKSLNHIGYRELEVDGRAAGSADRRARACLG